MRVTRRRVLEAGALLPVMAAAGGIARARATDEPSAILLAAPPVHDDYYRERRREILDFHVGFARRAEEREPVLVITDAASKREFGDRLAPGRTLAGTAADIWLVDFAPVQAAGRLVKFVHRPNYLDNATGRWIDRWFRRWLEEIGIEFRTLDLVLDGGNLVYDGASQAVVTEQVLVDNRGERAETLRDDLRRALGLDRLAVIPREPGDITGHADGMVKWLHPGLLAVSSYDEPLRSKVLGALSRDFPGVELIEVPYAPTQGLWRGWPTASGDYVNALTTERAFYMPVYGLPADDAAVAAFTRISTREVVAIDASGVSVMGGAVHCLSWYVTGEPAARLLAAAT